MSMCVCGGTVRVVLDRLYQPIVMLIIIGGYIGNRLQPAVGSAFPPCICRPDIACVKATAAGRVLVHAW